MDFLSGLADIVAEDPSAFCGQPRGTRDADDDDFETKVKKSVRADVRMFSGCMDAQTSADVGDVASFGLPPDAGPGGAGGACTNAMILNLCENDGNCTWLELLRSMQITLKEKGFTQVPQVSASRKIDLDGPFSLMNPEPSGNTRSLLVGINYVGQQGELRGCHNDVIQMSGYVFGHGFDEGESRTLMDDGSHDDPTRDNIIAGFRWLVEGAAAGDSLFFHYSGHGGSMPDDNGDEKDGNDETMVPLDFMSAGQIRDDEIFKELVAPLPEGVQLTCVMDCCHSGTILDLPYSFVASEEEMEAVAGGAVPQMAPNPGFSFAKVLKVGMEMYQMYQGGASTADLGVTAARAFGPDAMRALGGLTRNQAGGSAGNEVTTLCGNCTLF